MDKDFKVIMGSSKHRYLMPLDGEIRKRIEPLRKPYPKRVKHSVDAVAIHATEGGSTPTDTLQTKLQGRHERGHHQQRHRQHP